jgi:hypothetical protein
MIGVSSVTLLLDIVVSVLVCCHTTNISILGL